MKILTILGARPQFIKASAVSRAIRSHNQKTPHSTIDEVIVHTGQHYDANMSEIFFEQLDIPRPDHNIGIFGLNHGAMTGRMLEGIENLILQEQPDWVLVYGDTNTTLAGALAAAKLHIPVAHVEAGLRSYNMAMPEEINRVLTDRVSTNLFCPTQTALSNLHTEGYPFVLPGKRQQQIENVGDVMYDVTLYYREIALQQIDLNQYGLVDGKYALCTLHRAENTDDLARLEGILNALREIARDCPVVMPLHPRTRNLLTESGKDKLLDGLHLKEPVPYIDMQRLEMGAKVILTDSGGIQKEAYFHSVPCITLRDETEWVETVEMGWNQIVGANQDLIIDAYEQTKPQLKGVGQPYGDGHAAEKIVQSMLDISRQA